MPAFEPRYLRFENSPRALPGRPELLDYWHSIRSRKWRVLAAGVLLAVLAGLASLLITPLHEAEALLLIGDNPGQLLSLDDLSEVQGGRSHFVTQAEYLGARSLGLRVVDSLKLWDEAEFDPRRARPGLRARLLGLIGKTPEAIEWTPELLTEVTWQRYASRLQVAPVGKSQLLAIRFYAADPALAARVANGVVDNYLGALLETRILNAEQAGEVLSQHEAQQLQNLKSSERALQAFRERRGLVDLGGNGQALVAQRITDLGIQLASARSRRISAESTWEQARTAAPDERARLPGVLGNADVQNARGVSDLARQNLARLQERYGSEHPRLREAAAELASAEERLNSLISVALAGLEADAQRARTSERMLQAELDSARAVVQRLNRDEAALAALERQVASDRSYHARFSVRNKEVSAQRDLRGDPARLIQSASPQLRPVSPNRPRLILTGGVLGLLLAALLAILRDRLALGVFSASEAERRFAHPVLAELPWVSLPWVRSLATVQVDAPLSRLAESIRSLRSSILLADLDLSCRRTLITSSVAGEGKSTISANLALAMAQTGPCLLIDADLRRAGLTEQLGVQRELPGLGNHLQLGVEVERCIHRLIGSDLDVMPAGLALTEPLEALQSPRMVELLTQLSTRYANIIIDSPPLAPVSDALALAPLCTRCLLVVRARDTVHPLSARSLRRLQRARGRILGLVFNNVTSPPGPTASGLAMQPAISEA
ncbi:polysaccharide biosynthesis tyrosine autokinase [Uliginosibacterium sp. TH139]|uniref:GumC family protein n=1 Tax=Uliginosibacterium sp. TH139 TaxID=2067453 RepID=UPI000C7D4349|nr:polysaccharide biosynthesis tyrosine autokinase [Uliginosibacterium sp. TH139]PLK50685.1 hypothetical protein C0V76_02410 [Uliginosibacterium sp. TH139]